MGFSVSRTVIGDVVVLRLTGPANGPEGAVRLRDAAVPLFNEGYKKVVLDCSEFTYTDSALQGAVVGCFISLKNVKGELVLANVQTRVIQVFQIQKIYSLFRFFDTVPDALKYFGVPQSQAASQGAEE